MPMSGLKTCEKIRQELDLQIPIIFSSANNTESDIKTYYSVGGNDFFDKPIKKHEEFYSKIKKHLKIE